MWSIGEHEYQILVMWSNVSHITSHVINPVPVMWSHTHPSFSLSERSSPLSPPSAFHLLYRSMSSVRHEFFLAFLMKRCFSSSFAFGLCKDTCKWVDTQNTQVLFSIERQTVELCVVVLKQMLYSGTTLKGHSWNKDISILRYILNMHSGVPKRWKQNKQKFNRYIFAWANISQSTVVSSNFPRKEYNLANCWLKQAVDQ